MIQQIRKSYTEHILVMSKNQLKILKIKEIFGLKESHLVCLSSLQQMTFLLPIE